MSIQQRLEIFARDNAQTIEHLRRFANHPNTGKPEADNARDKIKRLQAYKPAKPPKINVPAGHKIVGRYVHANGHKAVITQAKNSTEHHVFHSDSSKPSSTHKSHLSANDHLENQGYSRNRLN